MPQPPLPRRPTTPLPGPRWPGEYEDWEWREQALIIAIRAHMTNPDPLVQHLVANWAAEVAILQEVRRGRNDCG